MQNRAKLRSYNTSPKYKFGNQTPRDNDDEHALSIDKKNGNTKSSGSIKLEIDPQHDYETFNDLGKTTSKRTQKNRVHFVFDVKHDGRHKARVVVDGNPTDVPLSSVNSGVASLRGIRMVLFVAELNMLDS